MIRQTSVARNKSNQTFQMSLLRRTRDTLPSTRIHREQFAPGAFPCQQQAIENLRPPLELSSDPLAGEGVQITHVTGLTAPSADIHPGALGEVERQLIRCQTCNHT